MPLDVPEELDANADPRNLRSWYNRLLAFFLSQRIEPQSGITGHSDESGTALAFKQELPIRVQLSGASSPYSFTQIFDATGGTTSTPTNPLTGTTNAYEVNAVPRLDQKIIDELWRSRADNAWKFQWPGMPTSMASCSLCVTVENPCFAFVPSQLVTITGPASFNKTCTTDASGKCCVTVPATGTYTVAINRAGFNNFSANVSVTCPGTTHYTANLTVPAGSHCTAFCPDPFPDILHLTDANGTIAITRQASSTCNSITWFGCYTVTLPGQTATQPGGPGTACVMANANVTVAIAYYISISSSGWGASYAYNTSGPCFIFGGGPVSCIPAPSACAPYPTGVVSTQTVPCDCIRSVPSSANPLSCAIPVNQSFTFGGASCAPGGGSIPIGSASVGP